MHFDFPIETIKFDFEHKGTGQGFIINLIWNDLIFYGWVRVKQR